MRELFVIVFGLLLTSSAMAAAWTVWLAASNPAKLVWLDRPPSRTDIAKHALAVAGFGVFVYGGAYSAFLWMPHDLGSDTADGFISLRIVASLTVAIFGAIPAYSFVTNTARLRLMEHNLVPADLIAALDAYGASREPPISRAETIRYALREWLQMMGLLRV